MLRVHRLEHALEVRQNRAKEKGPRVGHARDELVVRHACELFADARHANADNGADDVGRRIEPVVQKLDDELVQILNCVLDAFAGEERKNALHEALMQLGRAKGFDIKETILKSRH